MDGDTEMHLNGQIYKKQKRATRVSVNQEQPNEEYLPSSRLSSNSILYLIITSF
jgi:hypothetical protein